MFGLDLGCAELAGFVSREEDHPTGVFSVAFEHGRFLGSGLAQGFLLARGLTQGFLLLFRLS